MEDLGTEPIQEATNFGRHGTGIGLPPQHAHWLAQGILRFAHATMGAVIEGDCIYCHGERRE
jgi:hypothetical protein